MNIVFTVDVNPALAETFVGSVITILMLVVLAWAVRKFIGE